jgi:glycosyltransferase involved in cell wall biosynthesis
MKILYDYQTFEQQKFGGISRYFFEIIKNNIQNPDFEYYLPLIYSSNHYIQSIQTIKECLKGGSDFYDNFFNGYEFKGKWSLYNLRNKFFPNNLNKNRQTSIDFIKKMNFDIFHPTDISDYFLEHIGNKPFVITIHDMIDEIFPEYGFHIYSDYNQQVKKKLIQKARKIIAVSQTTKNDIIKFYDIDDNKIEVIYHSNSIYSPDDNKYDDDKSFKKYFIFVGKRVHYKNFYFFISAISDILLREDIKVICVGANAFNNKEINYYKQIGLQNNILYVKANDKELSNLYKNALGLIYPSLYEGFGIPVLEAFSNQCPCLLSNTPALLEVAQDAALYFSAKKVSEIRAVVERFLQSDSLRKELIEKGLKRAKDFSWEKTAQQTFDVYKNC